MENTIRDSTHWNQNRNRKRGHNAFQSFALESFNANSIDAEFKVFSEDSSLSNFHRPQSSSVKSTPIGMLSASEDEDALGIVSDERASEWMEQCMPYIRQWLRKQNTVDLETLVSIFKDKNVPKEVKKIFQ